MFSVSLSLSMWFTGSDQHYVRFWGSNPELPGGQQVNLPGRLCGQSSDVDRVSSVAGGQSRPRSGLASGNPVNAGGALIGSSSIGNLRYLWAEMTRVFS